MLLVISCFSNKYVTNKYLTINNMNKDRCCMSTTWVAGVVSAVIPSSLKNQNEIFPKSLYSLVTFVTISVLLVPMGVFSFSRLTPPRALSRFRALASLYHWIFVGGEENSLIEQVREMVEPGLTNTEDSAWITAVAAEKINIL